MKSSNMLNLPSVIEIPISLPKPSVKKHFHSHLVRVDFIWTLPQSTQGKYYSIIDELLSNCFSMSLMGILKSCLEQRDYFFITLLILIPNLRNDKFAFYLVEILSLEK